MPREDDPLAKLNDQLAEGSKKRGKRGGLGKVIQPTPGGNAFAAVLEQQRSKWPAAGEDPLYRRFTPGPVVGAGPGDDAALANGDTDAETRSWRSHINAALRDAGGSMAWPQLRDEVVERWRRELGSDGGKAGAGADEELWPHLALACIPESFLSHEDALIRLVEPEEVRATKKPKKSTA
mmetsp:Transcript_119453/g.338727  ORF Transcript_119453/g.338727 Transcript_119453/m.338727 type:complete len:180 (+) Transcript_119453:36-575(+)